MHQTTKHTKRRESGAGGAVEAGSQPAARGSFSAWQTSYRRAAFAQDARLIFSSLGNARGVPWTGEVLHAHAPITSEYLLEYIAPSQPAPSLLPHSPVHPPDRISSRKPRHPPPRSSGCLKRRAFIPGFHVVLQKRIPVIEMPSTPFRKPRHSLEAFDRLFERAFAPRETPALSLMTDDIRGPTAPEPPSPGTQFYSPVDSSFPIAPQQEVSLDPIWEEVRQTKEKELAASPSKVKSLEGSMSQTQSHQSSSQTHTIGQGQGPGYGKKRVTKRRSR